MRAVIYEGPGQVMIGEVDEPELFSPSDALVKIELAAICGSDLHVYHGAVPGVLPGMSLGHEFVGRVLETGPEVKRVKPGDRVVGSFHTACGECAACRKTRYFACTNGMVYGYGIAFGALGGAQAEKVRVPQADLSLRKIPDALPAEEAILAGDILSTAYGGVRPWLEPGMSVAVVGAGPVGLMAVEVARTLGAGSIYAVDFDAHRLGIAEKRGAIPLNPKERDPVSHLYRETDGFGADIVVEAVGGEGKALETAFKLAGPGGVVASLGVPTVETFTYPWLEAFTRGVRFHGSLANVPRWMDEVLALQQAGRISGSWIFSHRLTLDEAPHGYEMFDKRGAVKVALTPA
ncbi:MAG TPA: alcohol dehydrogenase catalytic domain-containing protein [Meiothermus sp.]|nr:alcohol dehydrogenase catalytic domain-containing protein [Meiothermus sp.]